MLDARIALGGQPMQIEPQSNALMRALQLQGQMQQNALAREQFTDMRATRDLQRKQMENALLKEQQRRQFLGQFDPNAGPARTLDPQALFASGLFSADDIEKIAKVTAPPKQEFMVVGNNVLPKDKPQAGPVWSAPAEATKPTTLMQNYQEAVKQGFKGTIFDYELRLRTAQAPKQEVRLDMGQKGLENTLSLNDKFKSEQVYKDFQDVSAAHAQIKTALSQGTPIADTAAATKIMKMLDPGSVVRESELGIAMAASGRLDRLKNYAQMWWSGTKLTPQQRQDFAALADELMSASADAYNKKRSHYEGIGNAFGLNPGMALGSPAAARARIKWEELK